MEVEKSSDTLDRFEGAIRAFRFGNSCGNSSGEKSNMCDSVQISCGIDAMYPDLYSSGIVTYFVQPRVFLPLFQFL